jgi:uncharacterized CHY-type Zn-finger protein
MDAESKTTVVLISLAVTFLGLRAGFQDDWWGQVTPLPSIPLVEPDVTNTATVRVSAAELMRTGGDTSGLECYTCHEKDKPPKIKFDTNNVVVLPKEHEDLVMRHGQHQRNVNCYNCHDQRNLEGLLTRDGTELKITDSTRLCGSCHGPTYRDWEVGIHGRTSGYWDRARGPITRQGCTSCHDPHNPVFPGRKPTPGPHPLHPVPRPPQPEPGEH